MRPVCLADVEDKTGMDEEEIRRLVTIRDDRAVSSKVEIIEEVVAAPGLVNLVADYKE